MLHVLTMVLIWVELEQGKLAVEAGYWPLYRYNPMLEAEGKNPFILDSKEPTGDFQEFVRMENRYNALLRQYPDLGKNFSFKLNKMRKDVISYTNVWLSNIKSNEYKKRLQYLKSLFTYHIER